jgi:arsenical pump membrane protein
LASLATKKANQSQFSLFAILYGLVAILTIFTSNDIVILTFTPFLCLFCKNAKINPIPYLVAEFAAANTWSLMLLIGNPTNIYLASMAGIPFFEYMKVMAIPTIFAGIVELGLLLLLFRKQLRKPLETKEEHYKIEDKADLWIGVAHLGVTLVLLSISNFLHWQMWLITLIAAISLLISVSLLHLFTHHNFKNS